MKRFKQFLSEEVSIQILILEGKAQNQIFKQFGGKILERIGIEDAPRGGPALGYQSTSHEKGHGTPEHLHNWISKRLRIPEAPHYLDLSKPEHENTWNQHLNWMLTRFAQGTAGANPTGISRIEDIQHRAIPALERYHKLVQAGKLKKESLAKWKNLGDLESAVNNADPINSTSVPENEYDKLGENEHWHVVVPRTSHAACQLGHGTKWCTTSGAFEHYNEHGPLYIMIPKNPRRAGEKYQLHLEERQLMDENDRPVDPWLFYDHSGKNDEGVSGGNWGRGLPSPMSGVMKSFLQQQKDWPNAKYTEEEQKHLEENHPVHAFKSFGAQGLSKEGTFKLLTSNAGAYGISNLDRANILTHSPHIGRDEIHGMLNSFEKYSSSNTRFHESIIKEIFENPDLKKHINSQEMESMALNSENAFIRLNAIRHGDLSHETIQKLHTHSWQNDPSNYYTHQIRSAAYNHPKTTESDFRKYMEKANNASRPHDLINNPSFLKHPNFPKDIVDTILDTPTDHLKRQDMASGPMSTAIRSHINRNSPYDTPFESNRFVDMQLQALQNPNIDPRHLTNAFNGHYSHSRQDEVFRAAIYNPSATAEHLMSAIKNAPIDRIAYSTAINGVRREKKMDYTHDILAHPIMKSDTPESRGIFDEMVKSVDIDNLGDIHALQKHFHYTPEHDDVIQEKHLTNKKGGGHSWFVRKFPITQPQGQPS